MKIEVRNLKKSFNDNFVLRDISLTIEKNKSTIILGQSGCGKSVLIKTIYQLFSFDSGYIKYDGKSEVDIDKFSMLFQYGALFDSLKISENIAFTDFINDGIIQDKGDCKKILKTKNIIFKSFITGAKY